MLQPVSAFENQDHWSIDDQEFDQIYPARIRKLSPLQWTPVRVAAEAAKLLATVPGTRMNIDGLGAANERADLIAYLRSLEGKPSP